MLRFPDPARLKLDRAVQDLLDRAGEVLRTQGRLRDLLRTVLAITADVTSPGGLDHLLTTACALLHARYGGLAVFHATGDLAEFLQMGTGPATSEGIKRCGPENEGVLRQLANGRQPLRIDDLTVHPIMAGTWPCSAPMPNSSPASRTTNASLKVCATGSSNRGDLRRQPHPQQGGRHRTRRPATGPGGRQPPRHRHQGHPCHRL
jgi:hypothetical protein